MKTLWTLLAVGLAAASIALAPASADAKRLGGGRAAGMQRAVPAQPAAPPQQAAPAPAPPQPAAPPAGRRSWLGPIAGLAAGIGLAALFSHLGLGAELSSVVMLGLLVLVAVIAIRFVARRLSTPRAQLAGGYRAERIEPLAASGTASPLPAAAGAPEAAALPGGMAAADFERLAKVVFIRLQAANDAGDIDDLRKFTTPELFASLRLDLQERGGVAQKTDVVQIDAKVIDVAEENGRYVVSVRFSGLIRENPDAGAEPFAEVWHLVRSAGDQGDWAIAGITPVQ